MTFAHTPTVQPASPWNLALVLDPSNPGHTLTFEQLRGPTSQPYNESATPGVIHGIARSISSWALLNNSAAPPPASPVDCSGTGACGGAVNVTLLPYGSTLLRIAVLPWVSE